MKRNVIALILIAGTLFSVQAQQKAEQVKLSKGIVEGTLLTSGIRSYKGIPFAQPPIGELRWKEPQPLKAWKGILKADHFGNKGMQKPVFGDMGFRAEQMSEDCLYLNVWAPKHKAGEKLPVMVYFYGGGMVAGDGSEPRYDGESLAKQGIVTLTVNYRLGIFGFMAHPELSKESAHHASGNYGLLDQHAALQWVKDNIAAFGGDPARVTIAGESAGSISVSAQMASPLSKGLIAGAIGESGAMISPTMPAVPLSAGEKKWLDFAAKVGAADITELRKIPAEQLLEDSYQHGMGGAPAVIDGYFLPENPAKIFTDGKQAKVPLLVGWNSAEIPYQAILKAEAPTPENYLKAITQLYGDKSSEVLKLYPGATAEEVSKSATALASDRFIVYSTWKWADLHQKTGEKAVYRYVFSKSKPPMTAAMKGSVPGLAGGFSKGSDKDAKPVVAQGAPHAFEIEYALGNLASNKVYEWTAADHQVSATMLGYFANFIKTGDPNGKGLTKWPALAGAEGANYINIDVETKAERDENAGRYFFLDKEYSK